MPAKDPIEYDLSWVIDRRLTLEEVCEYKKITKLPPCLVCGRKLRLLGAHLVTHQTNIEEYRNFYGLPRFMKLTDINTRKLKSEISTELQRLNVIGWKDRKKMAEHTVEMRKIEHNPNRPEMKSYIALQNCRELNKAKDGTDARERMIAKVRTKKETKEIRRIVAIKNESHKHIIKANEKSGWVKTLEHENRRVEVLKERAEIIRTTSADELGKALAEFKARCHAEKLKRIYAKRAARKSKKTSLADPGVLVERGD